MPRCISTAQRTASTALANSTSMPSPVVLTMRPRWLAMAGSIRSLRCPLSARSVADLIGAHELAVADDIRGQNGGQPALPQLAVDCVKAHARFSLRPL